MLGAAGEFRGKSSMITKIRNEELKWQGEERNQRSRWGNNTLRSWMVQDEDVSPFMNLSFNTLLTCLWEFMILEGLEESLRQMHWLIIF
jgi:hypothetical protein